MEKQVLGIKLKGLLVESRAWDKAHVIWFTKAAKQLQDFDVLDWAYKEDYFKGVDEAMKRLEPSLSDEERTAKARERYFDSVLEFINKNNCKIQENIDYFNSLKEKFKLILVTTNTKEFVNSLNIDIFDEIYTSLPEEKDDKLLVLERVPKLDILISDKKAKDYCEKNNIKLLAIPNDSQLELIKTYMEKL